MNPRAETHGSSTRELLIAYVHSRTASPSLHSCPASDRASSFLLAERPAGSSTEPCDPTEGKTRNASDRLLPPVRKLRAPAPRSFPAHSAAFATWAPRGFWDPRGLTGEQSVSHRFTRFGGTNHDTFVASRSFLASSRAWALSSHGAVSTEPLTSLSPLLLAVRAHTPSCVLSERGVCSAPLDARAGCPRTGR